MSSDADFDYEQVYQDSLQNLIEWCLVGQKQYAWWRAKQLAACETGIWRGIDIALTNYMRKHNESKRNSEEG